VDAVADVDILAMLLAEISDAAPAADGEPAEQEGSETTEAEIPPHDVTLTVPALPLPPAPPAASLPPSPEVAVQDGDGDVDAADAGVIDADTPASKPDPAMLAALAAAPKRAAPPAGTANPADAPGGETQEAVPAITDPAAVEATQDIDAAPAPDASEAAPVNAIARPRLAASEQSAPAAPSDETTDAARGERKRADGQAAANSDPQAARGARIAPVAASERGQDQALRPQPQFVAPSVEPIGGAKPAAEPLPNFGFTSAQGSGAMAAGGAASSAAGLAPAAAVALAELAVEIAARAQAGRTRFEIRLDPPELGRVDVRLDVDRDGNVSSRLIVDRSETLDLLRRDASQLERALQQAGLKMADNALEFALRDHAFRGDDGADRPAARVTIADTEPAATEAISQRYARSFGLGGGVDISV
jgi:hypothetical protein